MEPMNMPLLVEEALEEAHLEDEEALTIWSPWSYSCIWNDGALMMESPSVLMKHTLTYDDMAIGGLMGSWKWDLVHNEGLASIHMMI